MKRRILLTFFVLSVGIVFTIIFILNSNKEVGANPLPSSSDKAVQNPRPDPPGTINGAQNPDRIPDRAAYSILFLLFANRSSEEEKNNMRAYLNRFGTISEADINVLFSIANEYGQRVGVLDGQVKEIKDKHWPNPQPEVFHQLQALQGQKETITNGMAVMLRQRLSPEGARLITNQVIPQIKLRSKLTPPPQSPPGGPGWQPLQHKH